MKPRNITKDLKNFKSGHTERRAHKLLVDIFCKI